MRIAVVHDWLVTYAGAERVLEQMLELYPDADLFSVVDMIPPGERGFIRNKEVTTSFVQRMPFARRLYRHYLPLMPLAIEQLDLSAYDLILSSSHAVAKGVLSGPDQVHLSYVHSPMRYAWDLQNQYLGEAGLVRRVSGAIARCFLHELRAWDVVSSMRVDAFAANSEFIARRIRKVYRREATVIYPPVDVESHELCTDKSDYYVTVSRLVPYKRVDLIVEAFARMPHKRLVVVGDGPEMPRIRQEARANVSLAGHQPFEELREHVRRAKAFVYAAEEDFGIAPVEAQACGTPVIAYGKGGLAETVRSFGATEANPTGVLYSEQTAESLIEAIRTFERNAGSIKAEACRHNAVRFSIPEFRRKFGEFVQAHIR